MHYVREYEGVGWVVLIKARGTFREASEGTEEQEPT